MATTSKTLYRGAASATVTTLLYTVPSSTTTVITNIAVTNTSASSRTFTLYLGTNGSEVLLHSATSIDANTTAYIDCKQVLSTGQVIEGGASATDVTFHIAGVEIS
jgi:predicted solute-binding protein